MTEQFFGANTLAIVARYRTRILILSAATTGLAVFLGGAWLAVLQPARRTASVQFAVPFAEAYPNGLPFSTSDIVAPSIAADVHRANEVSTYCGADDFRSGLFVEEHSFEMQALEAEFRLRLSEPRLTQIDRTRLMSEYAQRRGTLPTEYRLTFVVPERCKAMPDAIVEKILGETLATWARESETRRGVLAIGSGSVSPDFVSSVVGTGASLVVRGDLLRRGVLEAIDNVASLVRAPGANLVRSPDKGRSFLEVRADLESLLHSRIEPLVASAVSVSADGSAWVRDALETAESRRAAHQASEEAYRSALREYSGGGAASAAVPGPRGSSTPADVGSLAPQIDSTFIDRLMQMAGVDAGYRRELTEGIVRAGLGVASSSVDVRYYQWLQGPRRVRPAEEVRAELQAATGIAKGLITEVGALREHYTNVALRPQSALATVLSAPHLSRLVAFGRREYALLIASVLLGSLVLGVLGALALERRRTV